MSNIFPKTRYQGSKYKLKNWIKDSLINYKFETVLDAFSGTSSIGYLFKEMNKTIYSNDILSFNYYIAKALIENNNELITEKDYKNIIIKQDNIDYKYFIKNTFQDIYYLDYENEWLDIVIQNILNLNNEYKQAMFLWALYQSCIIKRPYNLFHRKNLSIRTKDIERSFGNKTTWDKSFELHFKFFIDEINKAIFDNNKNNKAYSEDIFNLDVKVDLIYLDPPYIPKKGTLTKYKDFYHFLDGLTNYDNWHNMIDYTSINKKLNSNYNIFEDKHKILNGFETLINKYKDSIIVISYRDDGIPSIEDISNLLILNNKKVEIKTIDYKYVLSKNNNSKEVLIIGS